MKNNTASTTPSPRQTDDTGAVTRNDCPGEPGQTPPPSATSTPSVARSTVIMSAATALSRLTGFVRTWATALALGTTAAAGAYATANDVPNMIFELVAGGVLSSVFIPTFLDVRKRRGDDAAWKLASNLLTLCTLALGAMALVGTVFPQPFIWTQYFLPGKAAAVTAQVQNIANFLFRFLAIQVVFYGVGMIIQALLNAQRKYLWTSLGPVFNNLVVIAVMLAARRLPLGTRNYTFFSVGTSLGVLVMFAVMLPSLRKTGFRFHFRLDLRDPDLRAMLKLALPTLMYVITNLVAVSVRNAAAVTAGAGGQAMVTYANIWSNLPYGILAVSVATAVFTELSHHAAAHDMTAFKITLAGGLRTTLLLILPSSALLFGLARPLIALYVGGRMKIAAITPIVEVLQAWAVTLVLFAGMMFVLRSFYSLKDMKTVAVSNLFCTLLQVGGYLLLTGSVLPAHVLGIVGIPVADGLFYLAQFVVLLVLLRRRIGSFDLRGIMGVLLKMGGVSIAVGAVCLWLVRVLTPLFGTGRVGSLLVVAAGGVCGLVLTMAAAWVLRIDEVRGLFARFGLGRGQVRA